MRTLITALCFLAVSLAQGQERVHRPAQELQDKCVVYRGACTMRHHYAPIEAFPNTKYYPLVINDEHGTVLAEMDSVGQMTFYFSADSAAKVFAESVRKYYGENCLTLQDFVPLWDEYKSECRPDTGRFYFQMCYSCSKIYEGEKYFTRWLNKGHLPEREGNKEPDATDFLDWLSKKVKK